MTPQRVEHPLAPIWDARSRVLLLGTMPSPRSRAQGFYYGHPQNRFWRVLAAVLGEPLPEDIPEKRAMLLRRVGCAGLLRDRGGFGRLHPQPCPKRPGATTGGGTHPGSVCHWGAGRQTLQALAAASHRAPHHPAALHQPGQLCLPV